MRKGESSRGQAEIIINLQMKSASPANCPARARCKAGAEEGTAMRHQPSVNALPSRRAESTSAGNSFAVSGMKSIKNMNSATCTPAPTVNDRACNASRLPCQTSGSRNAHMAPAARPTPCAARACGKFADVSRITPRMIQRCQRGSTGKGTLMLLSRPSLWSFGLTRCMTAANATSTGSSERWQSVKRKCSRIAAEARWRPTSKPAKCAVPTSYSSA
mmetsp:Transcript_73262/g.218613  ORF Transcript_73262/g.218613 Transcript_73262/m.218613 type:complete len:217 (+) Transcript_73262:239-889(+)